MGVTVGVTVRGGGEDEEGKASFGSEKKLENLPKLPKPKRRFPNRTKTKLPANGE